jgi:Flp pilus assembly protein TadG
MKLIASKTNEGHASRQRQRGATAVEFAIVAPLLFMMLFGVVQFGWLFNNYVILTNAASVGAHVLATERGYSTPYSDTKSAILGTTSSLIGSPTITMSVGGTACSSDSACASALGSSTQPPAAGTQATVSLSYAFTSLAGGGVYYGLSYLLPSSLGAKMSDYVQ